VNKGDQLQAYYNMNRRRKKWWRRVVLYFLEVCIINAYVLLGYFHERHDSNGRKKRDILSFHLDLAHELVGGFRSHSGLGVREVRKKLS